MDTLQPLSYDFSRHGLEHNVYRLRRDEIGYQATQNTRSIRRWSWWPAPVSCWH